MTIRLSLREAGQQALAAAEAGDLDALSRALEARGAALAAGDVPDPQDQEDGDRVFVLLAAFVREARTELARLRHIEDGFSLGRADGQHLDCHG